MVISPWTDLAVKAGSAVALHVWQGMVHAVTANVAMLKAVREALDIAGDPAAHLDATKR